MNGTYIFKLSQLHCLYESRLSNLGKDTSINKTRLKKQLLDHFSYQCQEQSDGKNTLLVFKDGLKKLLRETTDSRDFEAEALAMAKLVKVVRQEIFEWAPFYFTGSFPPNCQENSVPPTLKTLISMLLYGPSVQQQDNTESQASHTISQLIYFNVKNKAPTVQNTRHIRDREPPLPLYIGLSVHTRTRSKKIVKLLNRLGISISYDCVLQLENLLANAVCNRFKEEGLVCPPNLRKGLYVAGALDNVDHDPSSTTCMDSFHGTAMSVFQFPTATEEGICMDPIVIQLDCTTDSFSLPESYINVPAVTCKINNLSVPETSLTDVQGHLEQAKDDEVKWTERALRLLIKDKLEKDDFISWAAFHASTEPEPTNPPALNALLPLFPEKAATITMVKHGMDILKQITNYLNPGQFPVTAFDQPLYALAKYVQWCWPQTLGEQHYVVMFGGLHIEMALWNTIGDFLDCSGWTSALCEAGVATSGRADAFLKAAHLTRTRRSHQVTALTLTKLREHAWEMVAPEEESMNFETWREKMIEKSPTFQHWELILEFEIAALIFVRAHRTKNFDLYIESLELLAPWFFALDHINYSRWIPIHIRDMKSLPDSIKCDLKKYWVISKTHNKFSSMPIDQVHEQNNKIVKGSGGAIWLTDNPVAFRRWMIAGPEQARLLSEFEGQFMEEDSPDGFEHHEQNLSSQELFKKQVSNLFTTMSSMGNPFMDDCPELLALDSRNCATEAVVDTVRRIKDTGQSQYQKFVTEVVVDRSATIHEKNSLPLWKRPSPRVVTKSKQKVASLKSDCNLFSHLYIASKFRDNNLEDFFSHENHPWPPSLSENGKLHLPSKKADLLSHLKMNSLPDLEGM